jgi:hypothetical protein
VIRKTAEAIQQEISREVSQRLWVIFSEMRRTSQLHLEAFEMAVLHRAGAAALAGLLQFAPPAETQRRIPCGCGMRRNITNYAASRF